VAFLVVIKIASGQVVAIDSLCGISTRSMMDWAVFSGKLRQQLVTECKAGNRHPDQMASWHPFRGFAQRSLARPQRRQVMDLLLFSIRSEFLEMFSLPHSAEKTIP
jgi:hypothetical protein